MMPMKMSKMMCPIHSSSPDERGQYLELKADMALSQDTMDDSLVVGDEKPPWAVIVSAR